MEVKEESDKKIIISTLHPEKIVSKCLFTTSCPHFQVHHHYLKLQQNRKYYDYLIATLQKHIHTWKVIYTYPIQQILIAGLLCITPSAKLGECQRLRLFNRICIPFFIGTELVSTCSSHVLSASQCNGSKSLVCHFQDQPMLLYNSHTSALPSSGGDRENHGEDRGHSWNTAEPLSAWCPDRVHTGEPLANLFTFPGL